MRILGIVGARFNPPTLGHLSVIQQALQTVDSVILVPSLKPQMGQSLAPYLHRFSMLRIFIDRLPHDIAKRVTFLNVEGMLLADKPRSMVHACDVMEKLEQYFRICGESVAMRFVVGPDNAQKKVWQKFYQYKQIEKRWPPLAVTEAVKARSQQVRQVIKKYHTKPQECQRRLHAALDPAILAYILRTGLYQR